MYANRYQHRAAEEFRTGKLDVDLWLDALARANGREDEAERLYVRLRARQLRERGISLSERRFRGFIRPSRFLWLYPLIFLVAGVLVFLAAVTGMLNPNAVPTNPPARFVMAAIGLALAAVGAWALRAARRALREAHNTES